MGEASIKQGKHILDVFSGCTTEEVQNVIEASDLLKLMVRADLKKVDRQAFAALLAPPVPTFENLFRTPEQLFEAFKARNTERKWGFSDEQIRQLCEQIPTLHKSTLQRLLTLRIWLGELSFTFEELWSWNKDVHDATWRWDYLKSDKKHLRLLDGKLYGKQLSVEWVVIDVTTNRGEAPKDVRNPSTSPDVEIFAAAALHPDWPKAINYDTIPGVWLPGLQATVPGGDAWGHVPVLRRHDRKVHLHAGWDDGRLSYYAVPVFREL